MNRIIILNGELETQMQLYLSLCDNYRVEIAEDEAQLMRMIRRKKPELIFLDADFSGFSVAGKSLPKMILKLKKKYQELKIITISNAESALSLRNKETNGSDRILIRPFDEDAIQQSVTQQFRQNQVAVNS